jgi:predicted SAM-dependent methyltransferase
MAPSKTLRERTGNFVHRLGTPLRRRLYLEQTWTGLAAVPSALGRRLGLDDRAAIGSRRLEIGSGANPHQGYIHVDADPAARHIEVRAQAWSLPFPDQWADEILSLHTLEHVAPPLLKPTLVEWRRVLRGGGRLQVYVPNATELMEAFLQRASREEDYWAISAAILGQQASREMRSPQDVRWPSDHQLLFTAERLVSLLDRAGFVAIEDRTHEADDHHTRHWQELVEHCSLYLEARAPPG